VQIAEPAGYLTLGFDFSSLSDDANLTAITAHARLRPQSSNYYTFGLDDLVAMGPNFANVNISVSPGLLVDIQSAATNTDVMDLKSVNSIKLHYSIDGASSWLMIYEFYVIVEGTGIDDWLPYVTVS